MNPVTQKNWSTFPILPAEISDALSAYPAYLRQLLYNRGIRTDTEAIQFFSADGDSHDPFQLLDMEKAVRRLLQAIESHEPIAVYGDYDVDGVTATALMVEVLTVLGGNAIRYIPNRFDEGYGVNTDAIQGLADSGVKVILTVDCGIRSAFEVEFARGLGVEMIISDHHHPKNEIPPALAVICQKRQGDLYPYKDLSGVGLAYKIAQALFTMRPVNGWSADDWLDLVALGTVADIVPLTGENRQLVKRGLALIHQGKRKGLNSLIKVAGRSIEKINAVDIGFALGPRLNAGGRIETALDPYQLLVSQDENEIGLLAQKLDNYNTKRQGMTREMQSLAEAKFAEQGSKNLIADRDENYNSGVIGLVASKLVETYYRPAIIGCKDNEVTRASCRSIPEFHITDALDRCADLLVRHGGHSMAAGFTVANENWDELIERLELIADEAFGHEELVRTLKADIELPLDELPTDVLVNLKKFEPTGMENPEALFISRNVSCANFKTFGSDQSHLKFKAKFHNGWIEAIAWRQAYHLPINDGQYDLIYSFEENSYGSMTTQRLNIRDLRPSNP